MKLKLDRTLQAFLLLSLPGALLAACAMQAVDEGAPGGGDPTSSGGSSGSIGAGGIAGSVGAGGIAGSVGAGGIAGSVGAGGIAGSVGAGGIAGSSGSGGIAGGAGTAGSAGASGSAGSAGVSGGGAGGSAGSAGSSGSAGKGGSAGVSGGGAGGSAGSAGSAGSSGSAGTGGGPTESCTGCARISVPIDAAADSANFRIDLAALADLSAATITFRLCVHEATGGILQAYVQHGGSPDYAQLFQGWVPLSTITNCDVGFQNVAFNVGTTAGTFDKTNVGRIGIQVGGGNSAAWTNPTVIYIDSITITGATLGPYDFAAMSSVSASAMTGGPMFLSNDTSPAGSAITWLN